MKKDKKLIKDGKYNMSGIMNQAWSYVRAYGYSLKHVLYEVWQKAKESMKEYNWSVRVAEAAKKANRSNDYNDLTISSSAFYSNRTGLMGAHYVGD